MPTALVTGSNRAIGLEWTRQLAQEGWRVHATCRRPAEAHDLHVLRQAHPAVSVHRLDVTRAEDVQAVVAELADEPLDLLVNNAGIYLEKYAPAALGGLRYDDWLHTLAVNALGPVRVTEALLEPLARATEAVVAVLTSHMGSIAEIPGADSPYYRSSKSALNAAMKGLSFALRERGIKLLLVHPGWVRSRMGGWDAPRTPAEAVADMRRLLQRLSWADSGVFLRYDGSRIPW
ncbi:SDR family oxidoreductase [Ectothiorhodospiraceae bacterium 2226]|nr:SDR family oxidoreductase [Ectothiorhodospiraceae bacterium 2226]